jgi:hypothetical protein
MFMFQIKYFFVAIRIPESPYGENVPLNSVFKMFMIQKNLPQLLFFLLVAWQKLFKVCSNASMNSICLCYKP